MDSDSLVDRAVLDAPVLPVQFALVSAFSSDGFQPSRRGAKRKCARIHESSGVGSSEDLGFRSAEIVDNIVDEVNSA